MRDLQTIHDGDTGPIYRFVLKDGATVVDLSTIAVEMYVYDESGTLVARRAGLPVSPKSGGQFDLMLLGNETDWDGAGKVLIVKPKIYAACAPTGGPATNLLLNPSFDAATGTNPARLPDSWTLVGARTATWDNYANDPWPPSVFGTFQLCSHATISPLDPDYIQQSPAATIAIGDRLSVGCWHRLDGVVADAVGGAKNDNHGIFFRCGAQTDTFARFEIGTNDWYFVTGSVVSPTAETTVTVGIDGRGTKSSNRYDEAFAFKGNWRTPPIEPMRIPVQPRRRVAKTGGNVSAGTGSFESDSNSDGVADGWRLPVAGTNVYSIERNPTNVAHGSASQKIVLANGSGISLDRIERGRYVSGETWRAKVKVKTSGPLTGSPTAGQWAIQVRTDFFDGGPGGLVSGTVGNFGTDLATFTEFTSDIVLTKSVSSLVVTLNLNGVSGTAWLDDFVLTRV